MPLTDVIRLDGSGPDGVGLQGRGPDPADIQSQPPVPVQNVHDHFGNGSGGLSLGVRDTTTLQETVGPSPGDEFIPVPDDPLARGDGNGVPVHARAGGSVRFCHGISTSRKQDRYPKKICLTFRDPAAKTPRNALPVRRVPGECACHKDNAGKIPPGTFEPVAARQGKAGIRTFVCGPENPPPDDRHYDDRHSLADPPELADYRIAAGCNPIGNASSGGAGLALAQRMEDGEAPFGLWDVDIRRAQGFQRNRTCPGRRVTETFGLHCADHHPCRPPATGRGLRRSALHKHLRAHDVPARCSPDDFSGSTRPFGTARESEIGMGLAQAHRVTCVGKRGWRMYVDTGPDATRGKPRRICLAYAMASRSRAGCSRPWPACPRSMTRNPNATAVRADPGLSVTRKEVCR